jgi:acyl-CoA reductase-like NAD-dependent aldehyde dehydrogenase
VTVIRIAELCNQVLPPDVLDVVPGLSPVAGHALAADPLVKLVSSGGR